MTRPHSLPFELGLEPPLDSLENGPEADTEPRDGAGKVVIHIQLSNQDFGSNDDRDVIFALIDELVCALEIAHAGEIENDLWGHGFCSLHLTGLDALRLCSVARGVLQMASLPGGFVLEVVGSPPSTELPLSRGAA